MDGTANMIHMAGQFLSKHVAVKLVESKTFWTAKVFVSYNTLNEDLRGQNISLSTCFNVTCLLKNCPAIYTYAVAMSLYQINMIHAW